MSADDDSALVDAQPQLPRWAVRVGTASWYFIGFCAAVALLAVIMAASRDIVVPLVLGIVLAVIFNPLTTWLTRFRLPRGLAAAAVVILVIGIAVGSIVIVAAGLANQGDELVSRLDEALTDVGRWFDELNIDSALAEQARDSVYDSVGTVSAGLANQVVGAINSAVGIVTGTVLGLMVFYYLLKDGSKLVDGFIDGQRSDRQEQYRRISDDSAGRIQAYARGRTIMAAVNGGAIGVAALILGVPLAFAITVVNFVGAYIPYLGAWIGGAFAFLLALSAGGIELALAILVVSLVVNLALENALEPILLGEQLELHPLVVLLATVAGGLAAGLVGLILAAPLTAIGLNMYREIRSSGFFDE